MIRKKVTTALSLIFILFSLTSCVTDFLWGARDYKEEITQFYIGSDGRYVVLMGPQYHYVFADNSGTLREILALRQNNVLSLGDTTAFNLDNNNNVDGDLILEGAADLLPQSDIIKLQLLGYVPDQDGDIKIKLNLKGRRYSARYLQRKPRQNLRNGYFIKIHYRKNTGFAEGVGKAAITPVAVTLDAALLIGKVAILPFTLPYTTKGFK